MQNWNLDKYFTYPTKFIGFSRIDNAWDENDAEEEGADDDRGDDVASDADAVITANRITNRYASFFQQEKKWDCLQCLQATWMK